MTDEEIAVNWIRSQGWNEETLPSDEFRQMLQAFLAGLKSGRPEWHKVTNWKDNNQFPNDELKTYLVRLYQDHYVICELDITEGYSQFYLLDNLELIDPQDVVEWCELFKE